MNIFDFIKNISTTELVLIVVVMVLLFGAKIGVKMARAGGETVREIRSIKKEFARAVTGEDSKPSKSGKN